MLTEFPDVSDWQVETRGNEGVGFSLLQLRDAGSCGLRRLRGRMAWAVDE
jgi:hypothetical protein